MDPYLRAALKLLVRRVEEYLRTDELKTPESTAELMSAWAAEFLGDPKRDLEAHDATPPQPTTAATKEADSADAAPPAE